MGSTSPTERVTIEQELTPSPQTQAAIHNGLRAYNEKFAATNPVSPLWLVARTADDVICGGLQAGPEWDWLFIQWLWIAELHRGKGLGTQLLARAESFARQQQFTGIYLFTESFQAPDFYRRFGYSECGRLDSPAKGKTTFWFAKRF